MSATNKTSAEISTSPPSVILSHIVPINISTRSGGGGGVIHDNNDIDEDDILAQKIMISVHRGKKTITKIEGIPDKFNLVKILKKLKSKDVLSCGGHIAKDKETGKDFIVVQGSYSSEIAAFLTQEGIAEERFIVYRG
jgi:translation initiation factor 1